MAKPYRKRNRYCFNKSPINDYEMIHFLIEVLKNNFSDVENLGVFKYVVSRFFASSYSIEGVKRKKN